MIRIRAIALLLAAGVASAQGVPPAAGGEGRGQTIAIHLIQGDAWAPLPYEAVKGLILLQATLDGRPATILLDNGTDRTVVDAGFAQAAGIALRASDLGADTGRARLAARIAEDVTLALPHSLSVRGAMPAIDLAPMAAALGRPIAAVIGGDLLGQVALMVRPGKRQVSIVASGAITPGAGAVVIPVESGNQVAAEIDGKPVRLKIDLGSSGAIRLTDAAFARVIPGKAARARGSQTGADGVTRSTQAATADLRLGAIVARGVPIDGGYAQQGADGLLGNGFLSRGDTILDLRRGQLILSVARPAD